MRRLLLWLGAAAVAGLLAVPQLSAGALASAIKPS